MRLPEQVKRLGFVIGAIVAVVLLLRFVLLPEDLFSTKVHQAAAVERELAKPLRHAGVAACRECHGEQFDLKYGGRHRDIGCENCHGPAASHASDPATGNPPLPGEREDCLVCHGFDPTRPNGFPQVDPQEHKPRKRCVSCHDPHDPVPPKAPTDCAGCHGRIEQTKALSTHALLTCDGCHVVDERHMVEPRMALPTKPDSREMCGRCHVAGSEDPQASSAVVDMGSHGGNYVCWECHYAHLPEGRK